MISFHEVFHRIRSGEGLPFDVAREAMISVTEGAYEENQVAALLAAIETRGYRAHEIAGFAAALSEKVIPIPKVPVGTIDTCGTGGAPFPTLNVSTMTALVVAAGGVPVAKHGNRSASGRSGSLDVLEALGARIDLSPAQSQAVLKELGFCFVNARLHHPVLASVGPLRKRLGFRTVFNLLGPILSPARVRRQLVGVSHAEAGPMMAEALLQLGTERAWVVYGPQGIDELGVSGPSQVWEARPPRVRTFEIHPADFGLNPADAAKLAGGAPRYNAERLRSILAGELSPASEQVQLNAGAAFVIAGLHERLEEGIEEAREILASGAALALLDRYVHITQSLESSS